MGNRKTLEILVQMSFEAVNIVFILKPSGNMFWKFLNDMSTSYHQAFVARWDRKNAEACQTDVILQMFNISNELENQ